MKQFLLITIILLIPGSLMASVSEKRVALIIGNAAYKSMPLQNTLNDARAMDNALRDCNFQIIRELDASRRALIHNAPPCIFVEIITNNCIWDVGTSLDIPFFDER
jgi:hypothetical protein